MSFLKDKEWDEMDWLNKAIEPYTFSLNLELAKIAQRRDITTEDVVDLLTSHNYTLSLSAIVYSICVNSGVSKASFEMLQNIGLEKFFEFHIDSDAYFDLEKQLVVGEIFVHKKMESINDDMIREILPNLVLKCLKLSPSKINASTINEVMDILECREARSTSSVKKKVSALNHHLHEIYKENKWNIRNVDLAIKMLLWIQLYCHQEDRSSLANMSKLKCMIHNGHPIYSMEEIK